jgi:hypothetical protein
MWCSQGAAGRAVADSKTVGLACTAGRQRVCVNNNTKQGTCCVSACEQALVTAASGTGVSVTLYQVLQGGIGICHHPECAAVFGMWWVWVCRHPAGLSSWEVPVLGVRVSPLVACGCEGVSQQQAMSCVVEVVLGS